MNESFSHDFRSGFLYIRSSFRWSSGSPPLPFASSRVLFRCNALHVTSSLTPNMSRLIVSHMGRIHRADDSQFSSSDGSKIPPFWGSSNGLEVLVRFVFKRSGQ